MVSISSLSGDRCALREIVSFLAAFTRPAQGPRVDIPPAASVTGTLLGIKCCINKVLRVLPHGIWNRSCIANRNDGQLPEDVFHWENVKHLLVHLQLIYDTFCDEPIRKRILQYANHTRLISSKNT